MDITDIHKLIKRRVDMTEFPEVIKTFQEKDGKRVTIKHREWAPRFYGIMDSTGRKPDRELFLKSMTDQNSRDTELMYNSIVSYLKARGKYTEILRAVGNKRTFDDPDEKFFWVLSVLYWCQTYDIVPRMFLSPFETHEGAMMGVKKIGEGEIFKEDEDDYTSEIPL